jgi:hypothetical protein
MRALILLPVCLALWGCQSITRYSGDNFEVGAGGIQAFDDDNKACGIVADEAVSYDVRMAGSTSYERNRAYNRVYARCMTARGHRRRPYYVNFLPAR